MKRTVLAFIGFLALASSADVIDCSVERLVSARGEDERYAKADKSIVLEKSEQIREKDVIDAKAVVINRGREPVCVKVTFRSAIKVKNYQYWSGFYNQVHNAIVEGEGLGVLFPATAAIGETSSDILGIDPTVVVADVRPSCEKNGKSDGLLLAFPVYLDPGESFEVRVTRATGRARYRWRDVVERWYELFPKAFATADSIHPAAASAGASYLYWNADKFGVKDDAERARLLKQFFGSHGCWDWCYKPFVRAGDWAISDEWTVGWNRMDRKKTEAARQRTRDRLAPAKDLNVAPMWYLNVCWTEEEIWRKHFPGILRGTEPNIRKCWKQMTVRPIYCAGETGYAKLFKEGLRNVPLKFPDAKGIGWDSCFANSRIDEKHEGFAGTRPRSFEKGVPFAHESVGIAGLLDYAHAQFSGPHRMANALNYKLVAPWSVAVRGDAGLYEGTPMTRPERFWRIESLRCRFGPKKFITWHKGSEIKQLDWAKLEGLSAEEQTDAHRQIMDDNLLLSFYWGTVPAPLIPSENRDRWTSALPELIDLNARGWHPSAAVDAPKDILVVRYGDGLETRLAVINPTFVSRKATLTFPREYWPDFSFVKGRELTLELPPRDVTIVSPGGAARPARMLPYVPATKIRENGLLFWMNRSNLLDTWHDKL